MPIRLREPIPPFADVPDWVNGAIDKSELQGRPVLVHFWAISCYLCKEGLPFVNEWRDNYAEPYRLQVVGVHSPRSDKDKDPETVRGAIRQYELKHPVAIDNDLTITDSFMNEYVPAYYLFDAEGQMRFYGAGEKAIRMVEQRLHKLLGPKQ
jgi:thiol-disulfide isomerase/thioredoxin